MRKIPFRFVIVGIVVLTLIGGAYIVDYLIREKRSRESVVGLSAVTECAMKKMTFEDKKRIALAVKRDSREADASRIEAIHIYQKTFAALLRSCGDVDGAISKYWIKLGAFFLATDPEFEATLRSLDKQ